MGTLLGLVNLLAVGAIVAWLLAVVHTVLALTRPPRRTYAWAVSRGAPGDPGEMDPPTTHETFHFSDPSRTGAELPAWRVPGGNPDGPCVVLTHGWGSSRIGGLKRLAHITPHASEIVLWDLPGHGESPGRARMGADEHHALLALLGTLDGPFVLFGWSMGAGVTLRAASEADDALDIRTVICEAPYRRAITPARNVIRLRGMPHRLNLAPAIGFIGMRLGIGPNWRGFDREPIARRVRTPIVVLHGDEDPVCPIADGRAIASAAPNGRIVEIPGGGHNNLWTDPTLAATAGEALRDAIRAASTAPA